MCAILDRSLQPQTGWTFWTPPCCDQVRDLLLPLIQYSYSIAIHNIHTGTNYNILTTGRLDRKIEFPVPNEEARARILQIHARKMNVNKDVNFEELSQCTEDFNGAQCKAVCVEAVSCSRCGFTLTNQFHGSSQSTPPLPSSPLTLPPLS